MSRRRTYAVDLDGTLARWERGSGGQGVGEWLPGAREAVSKMLLADIEVVVHSCRATWEFGGGAEACAEFLRSGGFAPMMIVGREMNGCHTDDLNLAAHEVGVWVGVGKPIADAYIDDRGVTFMGDWESTLVIAKVVAG